MSIYKLTNQYSFEIFTRGSNESKFISLPSFGFNSKLGSFDIQAK